MKKLILLFIFLFVLFFKITTYKEGAKPKKIEITKPIKQLSNFVLYNNEIPNEIHYLYKNNKINTFKYKQIKDYFKHRNDMKNMSPDYICHYTFEEPQQENVYEYDLDDPYINKGKTFNYSKYDTDWLLSPYVEKYMYCLPKDKGYPSCAMLSCNKYDIEKHKFKMYDYINNDRLKIKKQSLDKLKQKRRKNEQAQKNDQKSNFDYLNLLKNNIILL